MGEEPNKPYGAHDDFMCALDASGPSKEEEAWYAKLQERLGLPQIEDAVIYHAAMYMMKDNKITREKAYIEAFPKESPENRKVLLGILEKILEGETLPDF